MSTGRRRISRKRCPRSRGGGRGWKRDAALERKRRRSSGRRSNFDGCSDMRAGEHTPFLDRKVQARRPSSTLNIRLRVADDEAADVASRQRSAERVTCVELGISLPSAPLAVVAGNSAGRIRGEDESFRFFATQGSHQRSSRPRCGARREALESLGDGHLGRKWMNEMRRRSAPRADSRALLASPALIRRALRRLDIVARFRFREMVRSSTERERRLSYHHHVARSFPRFAGDSW